MKNKLLETIDWEVLRTPNFIRRNGNFHEVGTDSLVRSDNYEKIHKTAITESFQYTSIEELKNIVNNFSLISGYPIEGYHEFQGGSKVIAFLRSDKDEICGHQFDEFLTLIQGYDGTQSFSIGTSSVLVRCQNQFSKILMQATVKNTKNHTLRREELMNQFQSYIVNKNKIYDTIEQFPNIKISKDLARKLVEDMIITDPENDFDNSSTRTQNKIMNIMDSVELEMNDLGENGFGFFNGLTHFSTHSQKQTHNVFGNIFGTKNALNQKAFNKMSEMLVN